MTASLDIGEFDAPILVFGGPYSNLEALQALMMTAASRGIATDHMLCTGDVVAYGADPQATVDLIRAADIAVVMGNCEESLAADSSDCGCGFDKGSACDVLATQWFAYASRALDAKTKAWMRSLPRQIDLTLDGRRLSAIHGSVSQINRFVFASSAGADKLAECKQAATDGVIAGHCGLPFSQFVGAHLWHNAGVIGLPANDGTPRVWYSVLHPRNESIVVEHCPLTYDHQTAATKMREYGLPSAYADALISGRWPAEDILPAEERDRGGRTIAPWSVVWPRAGVDSAAAEAAALGFGNL
jgi:predicted phosphodiesterase